MGLTHRNNISSLCNRSTVHSLSAETASSATCAAVATISQPVAWPAGNLPLGSLWILDLSLVLRVHCWIPEAHRDCSCCVDCVRIETCQKEATLLTFLWTLSYLALSLNPTKPLRTLNKRLSWALSAPSLPLPSAVLFSSSPFQRYCPGTLPRPSSRNRSQAVCLCRCVPIRLAQFISKFFTHIQK